ncbi:MAG TPA: heme ABC exporter ATP-binding protein CcmA [Aestuariivirga sp.]|nr:heme ABC exporter ATP-binding protein CcmA [Aestuariivirga sp.]
MMQLQAINLHCVRGGRSVFRDCSFALKAGELLEVTGPNGSGKTSLLRLIAGLGEATAGVLTLVSGQAELSIGQQAHFIAHSDAVKTALTVRENIVFWTAFLGGSQANEALAAFDLERLAPYSAGLLSSGQKRRLGLARLLAVPRVLWLLDEPTVGLDQASQRKLSEVMNAHLGKGGMIVAATHVPLEVEPLVRLDLGALL